MIGFKSFIYKCTDKMGLPHLVRQPLFLFIMRPFLFAQKDEDYSAVVAISL